MKNGEALKTQRLYRGMTQAVLAEKTGISVRVLQNFEQGVRDINRASVDAVLRISEALGCDVYDILNEREVRYLWEHDHE